MVNSETTFARRVSRWVLWLGIAYIITGFGLLVSILTGSLDLIVAALGSILLLVVFSLGTVVYREGLVTPENKVIAVCVLAAMGLLFGLTTYTRLPDELIFGAVFVVGVIVPHLAANRLGYGTQP
ncbi:hypothetical protein [Halovenus halobia]|uniref:hypothetical protein n=1 Tax=Halovenus halobia TaxID=3396622 RepID=UPI003F54F61F